MRTRLLILVVSLVLGVTAAFLAARYLSAETDRIQAEAEPVEVLVATADVPRGTTAEAALADGLIAVREIPRTYVSAGAVSSPRAIDGQVLAAALSPGEQVTRERFQLPSQAGLAYSIPEGFVAVAIPSDAVKGVAGLLKPGDHVMVAATFDPGPNTEDAATRVLLGKARVLAVGTSVGVEAPPAEQQRGAGIGSNTQEDEQASTTAAPTVTLALTPADAEKLIFAEEKGSVWLALLPAGDTTVPATTGRTLNTLYK
jgi:pilus assembly protein CpaB